MTFGKAAGLTAGFIGAFGLGVAVGPSMINRDGRPVAASIPEASADTAPEIAENKAETPAPTRTPARPRAGVSRLRRSDDVVVVAPATHPELQQRLKPVLNRGADLRKAADGFRNGEEFAAVAHAAHNTNVPFMLLKHRVLDERMSLDKAIRASAPFLNAAAEAQKARMAARSDVASLAL